LDNGHLRSDVYCDQKPERRANRLSALAPVVKSALWVAAINHHDFLFYIHSGVVRRGDSCILLPAAAGSGKSSLTAALTPAGVAAQDAVPVSHIVFPRYRAGTPTALVPLSRSEAVGILMGQCLALRRRLDHANVRELMRWIGAIDCYRLDFADLESAVDLVKA